MDRNRFYPNLYGNEERKFSKNFYKLDPNMTAYTGTKKSDLNQGLIDKSLLNNFTNMDHPLIRNLGECYEKNLKGNFEKEHNKNEMKNDRKEKLESKFKMEFHIFSGFANLFGSIFTNIANVMFQTKQEELNSDYSYEYFDADTMYPDDLITCFENETNGDNCVANDDFKNRTQQDLNPFQDQSNLCTVSNNINCTGLCECESEICEGSCDASMMNASVECQSAAEQCESKLDIIKEILVTKTIAKSERKIKVTRAKKAFVDPKQVTHEDEEAVYDDIAYMSNIETTEYKNPGLIMKSELAKVEAMPCIKIEKSDNSIESEEKTLLSSTDVSEEKDDTKCKEIDECDAAINQNMINLVLEELPSDCCQNATHNDSTNKEIFEESNKVLNLIDSAVDSNKLDNAILSDEAHIEDLNINISKIEITPKDDLLTNDSKRVEKQTAELKTCVSNSKVAIISQSEPQTATITMEPSNIVLAPDIVQTSVDTAKSIIPNGECGIKAADNCKSNTSTTSQILTKRQELTPITKCLEHKAENSKKSLNSVDPLINPALRCEDKIRAISELLKKRSTKSRYSRFDNDDYSDYVEEPDVRYPKSNKYSKKQKNPNRLDVKKPKPKSLKQNVSENMCFGSEISSDSLSSSVENDSPVIKVTKPEACSFDEVKGGFHDNTESDDSFVIVFSDSPKERQRIPSDCCSEDSFIICFEEDHENNTCYTSTDVFGEGSGSSELDSELSDVETEQLCSKSHLSRTISDLTDESLYADEPEVKKGILVDRTISSDAIDSSGKDSPDLSPKKKVRFDEKPPKVHVMRVWSFAARQARRGPWERMVLDRERFRKRIADVDMAISWALKPQHRNRIKFQRFMPWWHAQRRKEQAEKKERERIEKEEKERLEEEARKAQEEANESEESSSDGEKRDEEVVKDSAESSDDGEKQEEKVDSADEAVLSAQPELGCVQKPVIALSSIMVGYKC